MPHAAAPMMILLAAAAVGCTVSGDGEVALDPPAPDYAACRNPYAWTDPGDPGGVVWTTSCDRQSCAETAVAADALRRVEESLSAAGVGDGYRFLRARETGGGAVELSFLAEIDWFAAVDTAALPAGLDDAAFAAWLEATFCLALPSVVSYASFVARLTSCDSSIEHGTCSNALRPQNGCYPVGGGSGDADAPEGECVFHTHAAVDAEAGQLVECDVNQEACP